MKPENIKILESLSLFCHVSGIITVFLGVIIILMDLANNDFSHIQVGFFVLVTGYALVKISSQLSAVLYSEQDRLGDGILRERRRQS
jgi:uncharacterized membrane protein HdeD (DUF308 family)